MWFENVISATRYFDGSLSTNFVTAASAASSRVGLTSFAPIDPETSIISTTVAPSLALLNFAWGRAKPTSSRISATPNRIAGIYRRNPGAPTTMFGRSAGEAHFAARRSRLESIQR